MLQFPKVGETVRYQYNVGRFADAVVQSVNDGVCDLYVGSFADVVTGVTRGHGTGKYLYYGTRGAYGKTIVGLTVTPDTVSGTAGGAATQLAVTATTYSGETLTVTSEASYASDNTGVATVSSGGAVTPVAAGTATVTVTYEGQTATVAVTVA